MNDWSANFEYGGRAYDVICRMEQQAGDTLAGTMRITSPVTPADIDALSASGSKQQDAFMRRDGTVSQFRFRILVVDTAAIDGVPVLDVVGAFVGPAIPPNPST